MPIIAAIVVTLLVFFILLYNNLVHLRNNVQNSKSAIDVYLQQRFDLIPNLVEVTKGYANYENEVLNKIAELRAQFNETKDMNVSNELNEHYSNFMAIAENNPNLKASEQFLNLQKNLSKIESQLQAARRIYNVDVTKYNTAISTFPRNIITIFFTFKKEPLYALDGEDKVDVEF